MCIPFMSKNTVITKTWFLLLKILLLLLGISSIAALPSLVFTEIGGFPEEFGLFPEAYVKSIFQIVSQTISPFGLTFMSRGVEMNLFPFILEAYFYSISILFCAFSLALIAAFCCSILYILSPSPMRKIFRGILMFFESIPDVILILALQYGVITLFKETGFKMLQIYGLEDKVYLFPILCLSVVPAAMMVRSLINILEEEHEKLYVEFAKAKGISSFQILMKHVLRNVVLSMHQHMAAIYWFMLSSLVVIEFLFQMEGITRFIYAYKEQTVIAIGILLILLPFGFMMWFSKTCYSFVIRGSSYE